MYPHHRPTISHIGQAVVSLFFRNGDAGYIDDSGKIHIDIFAGQEKSAFIARDSTLTSTLLHELTHFIHDWSPKAWKEMYNYVVARYSPYGSVQAALEAIKAREELEGRDEITDDLARDEFMAQCCEALFEDEAGMRDFAAKYKNTAQKIVEWLENVLEKISGINMGHSESDIATVISQWQDGIGELREKWLAALEDAANNKNASEGVLQSSAKTEGKGNSNIRKSYRGKAADGKSMYEGNYPKGTPKAAKSERILNYIQNVWSKEPIKLLISNGEMSRAIYAQFDPYIDPKKVIASDASKIAGGNRHGTSSEQRVTLDLGDDYYRIASEAKYNYSKYETGKDALTHEDIIMWHYFIDEIYFAENGSDEYIPYTVTINVKEKADGNYVYSFNAEKESPTRRTLHADVIAKKGNNGELYYDNISTEEKSQEKNENNTSTESDNKRSSRSNRDDTRNVFGFEVNKSARVNEDLLEELSIHDPNASVDRNGNITVYHRTTNENADLIRKTGIMKAKEDALFFSSRPEGYASDYGNEVMAFNIPSTVLEVNDIFDGEVHFDIPLKMRNGEFSLDVRSYLIESENTSESDNIRRSRSKRDEKSGAAAIAEAKAGEIAEKWGLSGKKTEALGRGLTNIFESVSGAEVDMAFVRQQAASLAASAVRGMTVANIPTDISDKLSFLRSFVAVRLSEEQRREAAKLAGLSRSTAPVHLPL